MRVLVISISAILACVAIPRAEDGISDQLMAQVRSTNGSVRTGTIWKIRGSPQGRVAVHALLRDLESSNRESRNAAACALKDFGPYWGREGTGAALLALVHRDPEGASPCAFEALSDAGQHIHISLQEAPALLRLNPNYDHFVEGPIAELGEPVVPLLVSTISDRDIFKRMLAIRILGKMGPAARSSLPDLKKLFSDRRYDFDLIAAHSVLGIDHDDREALGIVMDAVRSKRGNRYWSVIELGHYKENPEVQKLLEDSFNDKDDVINRAAATALGRPPRQRLAEKYTVVRWLSLLPFYAAIWTYVFFKLLVAFTLAVVCGWSSFRYQRKGDSPAPISLAVAIASGTGFVLTAIYIIIAGPFNRFHM